MIILPYAEDVLDADAVLVGMIRLAEAYPGQPVVVIKNETSGKLEAGVLSAYRPDGDDWFFNPVVLDSSFPAKVEAALADGVDTRKVDLDQTDPIGQ